MNVCYYQKQVDRLRWYENLILIVSGLGASAGVVTFLRTVGGAAELIVAFMALPAVLSVVGLTLRIPDKARSLGVLLNEYIAHTHVFEGLYQFGCTEDSVQAALQAFAKTEQLEGKDHPMPRRRLLEESQKIVLRRIGAPWTAAP
jgi:hypothetical protein